MSAWQAGETAEDKFGIRNVSGFYGPGSLAGWWLLATSVFIDRTFKVESDTTEKTLGSFLGLDFNLVGAFAYPFIASLDLLRNTGRYLDEEQGLASFDAPLIVVAEARVAFVFILVACALNRGTRHRHPRLSLTFACVAGAYLILVHDITVYRCYEAGWFSYLNLFLPLPYVQVLSGSTSCVDKLGAYVNYAFPRADTMYMLFAFAPSVAAYMYVFEGMFKIGGYHMGIAGLRTDRWSRAFDRRLIVRIGTFFATITAYWVLYAKGGVQTMFTLITLLGPGRQGIPKTQASLSDLDQQAALVVGGLLPLTWSIFTAVREGFKKERPTTSIPRAQSWPSNTTEPRIIS